MKTYFMKTYQNFRYTFRTRFFLYTSFYVKLSSIQKQLKSLKSICLNEHKMQNYSRLSLSRLRLSRTTAYLEEKIWSLLKHRNPKSGNKILWIRGEIAPREQFLPFPQYFQYIFLIKGVYLHIHLLNLVVRFVFSSILKI